MNAEKTYSRSRVTVRHDGDGNQPSREIWLYHDAKKLPDKVKLPRSTWWVQGVHETHAATRPELGDVFSRLPEPKEKNKAAA